MISTEAPSDSQTLEHQLIFSATLRIDGTGQITAEIQEFDTTPVINLDVEYVASDGRVFEQEVVRMLKIH